MTVDVFVFGTGDDDEILIKLAQNVLVLVFR